MTEGGHQVLNGRHIFAFFTQILSLFGTKFQYSCKRIEDEEGKQSDAAAIRDLVLTLSHNTQHPTKESETLDACIQQAPLVQRVERHYCLDNSMGFDDA